MRFLLVHGMAHGAWCWQPVVRELGYAGHRAVAIDLPAHGARQGECAPTLESMRDAVLDALRPGDVVVAHSWGGVPVTMALTTIDDPTARVIYLASIVPRDGDPALASGVTESRDAARRADNGRVVGADGWATYRSPTGARRLFFDDCDPQLGLWAFGKLGAVPPIGDQIVRLGPHPLPSPTYILTTRDNVLSPERQRSMAERLGVTPCGLDSGHSPFLSQPRALARLLADVVSTAEV